ncbi:MAG: alpha/beta fold hydrolase [Thermoleophilia bacterium]
MSAPRPILIHGSGGDHRLWAAQTAVLAGAVAVDLPGHPDGAPLTTLSALAEAVAAGVASVPGPRALVGHSLGGAVALEVARTRPELADGVVVVASGLRLPVPDTTVARARDDFAAEAARLVEGSFADPGAAMTTTARAVLDACGPDTLAADYAACRSVDLRDTAAGIRVPVLVICGDDDPFTPLHHNEALARALPMGRLVVVPGARHLVHAEFDVTVNLLLGAYLARLELTLDGA